MLNCRSCGIEVAPSAVWCPRCREPIPPAKTAPEPVDDAPEEITGVVSEAAQKQRRYRGLVAALAVVVLIVAGASGVWAVVALNQAPTSHARSLPTIVRPSLPPPLPSSPRPTVSVATAPADAVPCSTRVSVPVDGTSCAFAMVVAEQVGEVDAEEVRFTVRARSPHTGEKHTVSCVRDDRLTLCTDPTAHAEVWIANAVG